MFTVNDQVMVAPIEFNQEKRTARSGWELNDKISNALVGTKVLAKSKLFEAGDIVYVRASDTSVTGWVKNIYEFNGEKCIIMPESFVVLVDRNDKTITERPVPLPASGPGQ